MYTTHPPLLIYSRSYTTVYSIEWTLRRVYKNHFHPLTILSLFHFPSIGNSQSDENSLKRLAIFVLAIVTPVAIVCMCAILIYHCRSCIENSEMSGHSPRTPSQSDVTTVVSIHSSVLLFLPPPPFFFFFEGCYCPTGGELPEFSNISTDCEL